MSLKPSGVLFVAGKAAFVMEMSGAAGHATCKLAKRATGWI